MIPRWTQLQVNFPDLGVMRQAASSAASPDEAKAALEEQFPHYRFSLHASRGGPGLLVKASTDDRTGEISSGRDYTIVWSQPGQWANYS